MLDSINDDYTITAKRQKSTYKGVFRCGKKFKAQIQTNGVQNYLGLFDTEIEAAQAYDAHARIVLGSRAKTNFQYDTPASDDAAMPSEMYRSRSNKNTKRVYAGVKVRNTLEGTGLVSSNQQYAPTPQLHYHCELAAGESVNRKRSRPSDEHLYPEEVVYSGISHQETYAGDEYDEGEDPDWREQIYYWTGLLSFDRQHCQFQWNGSWVGSYTGKPESSEFLRSTNHFEYKSEVVADPSAALSGSSFVNSDGVRCGFLRPQSGYFRGYYMMDNDGSGSLEKYLDKAFYVEFEELPSSGEAGPLEYEVVGKGDSDFGAFVLSGTFYSETGILEVARQYITDVDERATMDLPQLRRLLSAK